MLNMSEIIRRQRRALGLTQEQMADRLGVSGPAVSKWEQGASYPDVTLLPALARLLETDLNTLMGFEREPDRAQLTAMLTEANDLAKTAGMEAAAARAKEMLAAYPNCGALLFGLAATLEGRMMMSGADEQTRERHRMLLESWYRRAAESKDAGAREAAAHLLAGKALSRGEIETAQEMMNRLPPEPVTTRWPLEVSLLLARGEKERARTLLENMLFRRAGDVQQILLRLEQAELDEGNMETGQALADLTQAFVGLMAMHPYVGHAAQMMAAIARKDAQAAIPAIRAMAQAMKTPWAPGACLPYRHADVRASGQGDMLAVMLREIREKPEYAFLREDTEFMQWLDMHQ